VAQLFSLGRITPRSLVKFIDEFRKLESAEFGFFVFAVCGSVCPGVLAIWLFSPDLLAASSTSKIALLSVSFMLPYIGANSWIVGMTTGCDPKTPPNKIYIQLFLQSSVYSLFMFSVCLAARFFFGVSLKWFLIILIVEEVFFLVRQLGSSQAIRQQNQEAEMGNQPPKTDAEKE